MFAHNIFWMSSSSLSHIQSIELHLANIHVNEVNEEVIWVFGCYAWWFLVVGALFSWRFQISWKNSLVLFSWVFKRTTVFAGIMVSVLSRSISFAGNWPFFIGVAVWGEAGLNNFLFFLLPCSLLYTILPLLPPVVQNHSFQIIFSRLGHCVALNLLKHGNHGGEGLVSVCHAGLEGHC